LQKVWELAAVSLSAQILTFPICIYYFHQFPNLFLVANMLAVPLSSVILYCLMSMVLLYKWALVAGCITKITVFLIACLNQIILFIDEVPLGTWKNISSNLLSTILLYVLIVSVSVWLFAKSKYWFFCMLSCSLVFVLYHSIQRVFSIKQQQLIIYQSPSHQIIEYIRGNAYAGLIDNKPIGNENKNLIKKYIDPANCFYRVDKLSAHLIQQPLDGILLYNFGNIRALVVDSSASYLPLKNKIKIDLLIVSKNVRPNFKTLLNTFEIGAVVFDATNTMWKIDKWEKECDALHLPHHNVIKNGAFVKGLSHF
jgi:competence protein ComEC